MQSIDVDFDVFKQLTILRDNETVTYNDVIRNLLGLPEKKQDILNHSNGEGDWFSKGVTFPVGTEFRAKYKGQIYYANVDEGFLVLSGERYDSPSSAAMSITKSPVNGWQFWECKLPAQSIWQSINAFRKR